MPENKTVDWFESWFDTPYYHLLYQNRSYAEAEQFITNLMHFLQAKKQTRWLDLACGKGRHAIFLNRLGYEVVGVDLAEENIRIANESRNERLSFLVKDMRQVVEPAAFDGVLNLFTSFGYFEQEQDNQQAIIAAAANLKPNGIFVIDFLNTPVTLKNLIATEQKTIENITFHLKRYLKDGFICKYISFEDKGQSFFFQEKVKAITLSDFEQYFQLAGLRIKHILGNYQLENYQENNSERLILIAEKV